MAQHTFTCFQKVPESDPMEHICELTTLLSNLRICSPIPLRLQYHARDDCRNSSEW